MRRVVVTGMGIVSPLGFGLDAVWRRLVAGESGAGKIEKFDTSAMGCHIAAEVPKPDGYGGGASAGDAAFNADDWVEPRDQRRMGDFIMYTESRPRRWRLTIPRSSSKQTKSANVSAL